MHYYFVDQIERKILELLLIELLEYCKTFSLIWRNEFYDRSYKKYHDEFIANLEKFIIKQEKVFSWPGTRITGIPATRYTFDFSEDSLNVFQFIPVGVLKTFLCKIITIFQFLRPFHMSI